MMGSGNRKVGLAVVGCDFRRASSRWRSLLVLDDDERDEMCRELARSASVDGFVDLNTCNRTEWIVSTQTPDWAVEIMRAAMIDRLQPSGDRIEPYVYVGEMAARHMLSVSIGQESFVVGERQIATQFFRALEDARELGTSSRLLNGLGSITGRLVRDAVREGCIGGAAVGVHSLAYHHVVDWVEENARGWRVAIVGLGAIGRRVRGLFEEDPRFSTVSVNRTIPEGEEGRVRSIRELAAVLAEVDAAVVCTSAPHRVVKSATIEGRAPAWPLLVLDIGIPEQVEAFDPGTGAQRAGLDDLTFEPGGSRDIVERTRHEEIAEVLVSKALDEFVIFAREGSVVEVFEEVRRLHERFVGRDIPRFIEERVGGLDESQKAHLAFGLKGMVLGYTNDIFRAIKRSLADESEEDEWTDVS